MEDSVIRNLWEEFHVPRNIRKHMEKVSDISIRLGKKLIDRGIDIDLKRLRQAALLHDLAKIVVCFDDIHKFEDNTKVEDIEVWNKLQTMYEGMKDSEITAMVLRNLNENHLAEIIRKHHFTSVIEEGNAPTTWEEKILYYADKLVMHDKEVTLRARLRDLDKRYSPDGDVPDAVKEAKKKARALEKEIETILAH
ncbi:MAG: HD domain-containing protein [Patescibacteria group bacterium]|nr:HD domain-containing protein [Patescibacteria group bacterium]